MKRRSALVVAVALVVAGCGGGFGAGVPECEESPRRPTGAMILSAQAVPSAEYAPCIDELELGWHEVQFEVESGKAEFTINETLTPFLRVSLTASCPVKGDGPLPTAYPDIEKYEDVATEVGADVHVVIVPTAELAAVRAGGIAREFAGTEVDDRLVEFAVDGDLAVPVRDRVVRALFDADFVWIIDELGATEGTVRVRQTADVDVASGVSPDEALERMRRYIDEPAYRGFWYFTFVGGCITYEFDAKGRIAETIEEDVASAIGFYDLDALRDFARRNGVIIEQLPPPGG